jgi:hypothetical protein
MSAEGEIRGEMFLRNFRIIVLTTASYLWYKIVARKNKTAL